MKRVYWFVSNALALLQPLSVSAEAAEPATAHCQLLVATGPKDKIYSKLFQNMRATCGAEIKLCEVESEGGFANALKLSGNEAEIGFVQIDTLQGMKTTDEGIASLRAVISANSNMLHILVPRDGYHVPSFFDFLPWTKTSLPINTLSDLKGLPVAAVGSAQYLARKLNEDFNLGLIIVNKDSDEQAVATLKAGEVAAVLCMSGWPNTTVEKVAREGTIKLAEYDLPARAPYQIMKKNYPRLDAIDVPFLAARNILVTRLRPDTPEGARVAELKRCLMDHLEALQEGRYEPGWKEVKNMDDTFGWPRFEMTGQRGHR